MLLMPVVDLVTFQTMGLQDPVCKLRTTYVRTVRSYVAHKGMYDYVLDMYVCAVDVLTVVPN